MSNSAILKFCMYNILSEDLHSLAFKASLLQKLNIKRKRVNVDEYTMDDLELIDYNPHKKIAMQMAVWDLEPLILLYVGQNFTQWMCPESKHEKYASDNCLVQILVYILLKEHKHLERFGWNPDIRKCLIHSCQSRIRENQCESEHSLCAFIQDSIAWIIQSKKLTVSWFTMYFEQDKQDSKKASNYKTSTYHTFCCPRKSSTQFPSWAFSDFNSSPQGLCIINLWAGRGSLRAQICTGRFCQFWRQILWGLPFTRGKIRAKVIAHLNTKWKI